MKALLVLDGKLSVRFNEQT